MRSEILQALAVTAELCGKQMSEAAARVFLSDLDGYDERAILGALKRCRREVSGRLTVADVVSRLDDGRPTSDEAWALMPRSESQTVVWTDEMASAWGVACKIEGDRVAARMAFKAAYDREVTEAREARRPVNWWPSLGHDKAGRAGPLLEAVAKGRLLPAEVQDLLPYEAHPELERLVAPAVQRLQ